MVSRSLFSSHIDNDVMAVASQHHCCHFCDDDYQKKRALQVVRDYYAAIDNAETVNDHNWWDRIGRDLRGYILKWREQIEASEVLQQQRHKVAMMCGLFLRVRRYSHMPFYYENYCTLMIDDFDGGKAIAVFPSTAYMYQNDRGIWCHFMEHPFWAVDAITMPTIGMA